MSIIKKIRFIFCVLTLVQSLPLFSLAFVNMLPLNPDGSEPVLKLCAADVSGEHLLWDRVTGNSFILFIEPGACVPSKDTFINKLMEYIPSGHMKESDKLEFAVMKDLPKDVTEKVAGDYSGIVCSSKLIADERYYSRFTTSLSTLDEDALYCISAGPRAADGRRALVVAKVSVLSFGKIENARGELILHISDDGSIRSSNVCLSDSASSLTLKIVSSFGHYVCVPFDLIYSPRASTGTSSAGAGLSATSEATPAAADHEYRSCPICGEAAKRRCSGCHVQHYCSAEHQRADWKTHKARCALLKSTRVDGASLKI